MRKEIEIPLVILSIIVIIAIIFFGMSPNGKRILNNYNSSFQETDVEIIE